jgi:hypothetical protein
MTRYLILNFQSEDHTHGAENDSITRSVLVQRMREQIQRDPTRPIKRVYNEILTETAENLPVEDTPEFSSVLSSHALHHTNSS